MADVTTPAHGPAAAAHGGVTLLADDLTGAADTVVAFADAGWEAYLVLSPDPSGEPAFPGPGAVVARSLDTRAVGHEAASTRTRDAVADHALGDGGLYLKIDSTMRGAVAGQVRGALEGWRARHPGSFAVVCPAYPAMGRTVEEGTVLVRGRPVHLGPAGRDPVTPVTGSSIVDLLPGAAYAAPSPDPQELAHALRRLGRSHDVVCVGAGTERELDDLAAALVLLGPAAVPAGSAGLAQRLAERWRKGSPRPQVEREVLPVPAAPPLVVVSSLHEVALEQVRAAERTLGSGVAVHAPPDGAAADLAATRSWAARLGRETPPGTALVVTAPDPDEGPRNRTGRSVAAVLATAAEELLAGPDGRPGHFGSLVLVGGDGAAAVLTALGTSAVRVAGTVAEGVPIGRMVGGTCDGLTVVTKAGGFGDRETLTTIVRTLDPHQKEPP